MKSVILRLMRKTENDMKVCKGCASSRMILVECFHILTPIHACENKDTAMSCTFLTSPLMENSMNSCRCSNDDGSRSYLKRIDPRRPHLGVPSPRLRMIIMA